MATPEQNALLAMQLFGAPAQQFNEQNDARTKLLIQLTQQQRAEEEARLRTLQTQGFQRELETGRDSRARDLAKEQNDRFLEQEKMRNTREDARTTALQTRQDTKDKESERRQLDMQDAAERKQVLAEMNRLYPQYAAAAAKAGVEIKQRNEFPETNEGLGQLAADLQTVAAGYDERQKKAAATSIIGGLDEITSAVDEVKGRIADLSKPQPDEEKQARSMAVAALNKSITNGDIQSAIKLNAKAVADGLNALRKGEDAIAAKLLGEEAMARFQGATEEVLFSMPNRRAAIEEQKRLNQQLLQLQSQAARVGSDVTKAAAANLYLADELSTRRSTLQKIMTPPPAAAPRSTADVMGALRPTAAASESAALPGANTGSGVSALTTPTPVSAAPSPSRYLDLNTLQSVVGERPAVADLGSSGNINRNDSVADWMRGTAYGLTNLMRPANWNQRAGRNDSTMLVYEPENGFLIPQLESRLAALDPRSPTAQELRAQLERLKLQTTVLPSAQPQPSPLLNLQTGNVLTPPLSFGQGG